MGYVVARQRPIEQPLRQQQHQPAAAEKMRKQTKLMEILAAEDRKQLTMQFFIQISS